MPKIPKMPELLDVVKWVLVFWGLAVATSSVVWTSSVLGQEQPPQPSPLLPPQLDSMDFCTETCSKYTLPMNENEDLDSGIDNGNDLTATLIDGRCYCEPFSC